MNADKQWKLRQLAVCEILDSLAEVFAEAQCEFAPVKGGAIIRSGHASMFAEREMCDIDIILHACDLERMTERFFSDGRCIPVCRYSENRKKTETQFEWLWEGQPFLVELHSRLADSCWFELEVGPILGRALHAGAWERALLAEDQLLVAVCHALTHEHQPARASLTKEIRLWNSFRMKGDSFFVKEAESTGVAHYIGLSLGRADVVVKGLTDRVLVRALRVLDRMTFLSTSKSVKRIVFQFLQCCAPIDVAMSSLRDGRLNELRNQLLGAEKQVQSQL